jgi:hypothetical protein
MARKMMVMIPFGIGAIAIFTFVGGQLVMQLWNWLMPSIFGLPELTFWRAVGLLALSRILFGGMGMGGRGGKHHDDFTPEQKERFRRKMREKFGMGAPSDQESPAESR